MAGSFASALDSLLGLGRRVVRNERRELVAHVNASHGTARLAVPADHAVLAQLEICLRILAGCAEDEAIDKGVEQLAETFGVVCTIDDVPVVLLVGFRLRTKLAAEVFGWVCGEDFLSKEERREKALA